MCNHKDSKRIMNQIVNHADFLVGKNLLDKYGFEKDQPYYVLMLFSYPSIMQSVYQRLQLDERLKHIKKYFLFHDYNKLEYNTFFDSWTDGD